MMITKANSQDIIGIVRGCLDLYISSPWATVDMTPFVPLLVRLLSTKLEYDPAWALFIAKEDDIVIGFIGVEYTTHPLYPIFPTIREWAFWVHPKYRGKKVGWSLLQEVKAWGRSQGARGLMRAKLLTHVRPKRGPVELLIWEEL